jgi:hypothetical protein
MRGNRAVYKRLQGGIMHWNQWLLSAALGSMLLAMPAVAEDEHAKHHEHGGQANAELKLDDGKKWQTDASLRKGMTKIQAALQDNIGPIHRGEFTDAQYTLLGEGMLTELNAIFKNCTLPPKADAMIHLVLTQIMDGVLVMKGQRAGEVPRNGAIKVIQALADYGKFFAHPGWKPLQH